MGRLYQLWYEDFEARRRFLASIILIAFAYGIVSSIILERPEKQVTWEMLAVVCASTFVFSVYYCLKTNLSKFGSQLAQFDKVLMHRGLLTLAVLCAAIMSAVYVARSGSATVLAAVSDLSLKQAISSPSPLGLKTADRISNIVQVAASSKLPVNPKLLNTAGTKVVEASGTNSGIWSSALNILSYRSALTTTSPTGVPQERNCIVTPPKGNGITSGVAELTLNGNGCTQVLDNLRWSNVTFQNSVIAYHGGPTQLSGVRFENCQFRLDYSEASQRLAKAIASSDAVTISLP